MDTTSGLAGARLFLAGWGYKGRVKVDGRWTSLDDFDLAAHQERYLAERGSATYLQSTFRRGA